MGGKECPAFLGSGQGCLLGATGRLFSSCGGLPGSLSDSREAAGHPGAEEEGCGPGPAWGSSLGCPTCQILWGAHGGSLHPRGQTCLFSRAQQGALIKDRGALGGRREGQGDTCFWPKLHQIVEEKYIFLGNARYALSLRCHFPRQQG